MASNNIIAKQLKALDEEVAKRKLTTGNDTTDTNSNNRPSDAEWNKMTPRERKLFELTLKANKARKMNREEVVEEDKRINEDTESKLKKARQEWKNEQTKEEEELKANGLDPEKEKILNMTASEAEWRAKKSKKQNNEVGLSKTDPQLHFNSYKRRSKVLEGLSEEYEKQKEETKEEEFYPDAHHLRYGQSAPIPEDRLNHMVNDLEKAIAKRTNFSRRRANEEGGEYVTHINDRNRDFNKKASKAYDKYTSEIRQNLERGTAI